MFIQLVIILVLCGAMWMTRRRIKQKAIRPLEGYLWSLVWVVAAVVVLQPDLTVGRLAHALGIGRGADLALYGSIIVLLFLVFHLHVAHDQLERQLTELVRREALRDAGVSFYTEDTRSMGVKETEVVSSDGGASSIQDRH